jgi:hypothetical protein
MTEAMPFLQKFDITFLRPSTISWELLFVTKVPFFAGLGVLYF